jgi:hypothetical protein
MDNLKATKLIQRHRGRWPWRLQGSDAEIARRAERIYFRLAVACFLLAILFVVTACVLRRWGIMMLAGGLCAGATSCAIGHHQFVEILKLLHDSTAI